MEMEKNIVILILEFLKWGLHLPFSFENIKFPIPSVLRVRSGFRVPSVPGCLIFLGCLVFQVLSVPWVPSGPGYLEFRDAIC